MDTKSEDRLLGVALAALFATIVGELLGSELLMTVGVAVFAHAHVARFAVMSVVLAVHTARLSELNALDPAIVDRPR
jgi:uncharacterized membrane protein YgaE (UPF0421/DUF939 family)